MSPNSSTRNRAVFLSLWRHGPAFFDRSSSDQSRVTSHQSRDPPPQRFTLGRTPTWVSTWNSPRPAFPS